MIFIRIARRLIGLHYSNLEYLAFNTVAAQDLIFECLHRGVFYCLWEELQEWFLIGRLDSAADFFNGL